jgi:hypothetical protein
MAKIYIKNILNIDNFILKVLIDIVACPQKGQKLDNGCDKNVRTQYQQTVAQE